MSNDQVVLSPKLRAVYEALMAYKPPTLFICDRCEQLATQAASQTQRYGYPVCCGQTMTAKG